MTIIGIWVMVALLVVGCVWCFLAALGLVVMPDFYNRMQAASKAVTLGATCVVLATGLHFGTPEMMARSVLICVFFFLTVPVASHLITRAACMSGEPLAPGSVMNELAGRYDLQTHSCEPPVEEAPPESPPPPSAW